MGFQLMGMRCWKCLSEMGALCIPFEIEDTPESMTKLFIAKKMLPVCTKCINANPMFVAYENLKK